MKNMASLSDMLCLISKKIYNKVDIEEEINNTKTKE